jgi:hypothetical protein
MQTTVFSPGRHDDGAGATKASRATRSHSQGSSEPHVQLFMDVDAVQQLWTGIARRRLSRKTGDAQAAPGRPEFCTRLRHAAQGVSPVCAANGRLSVNVVPASEVETSIWLPWRFTTVAQAMASPWPVPCPKGLVVK